MQNEEQKELFDKLTEIKKEITALKAELNQIDDKKDRKKGQNPPFNI